MSIRDETTPGADAPEGTPEPIFRSFGAGASQVVLHDEYDARTFEEAVENYPRLADVLERAGRALSTAPALLRDLFYSFVQRAPVMDRDAQLSPSYELHRRIIEQVVGTREWAAVRAAGTVGDPLTASIATVAAAEKAIAALDRETLERANRLREIEENAAALFDRAEALDDMAAGAPPEKPERADTLREQAEEVRRQARELAEEAEGEAQALARHAEEQEDAVRRAARGALSEAEEEIDETNSVAAAFGGGGGRGGLGGHGARGGALTTREKVDLALRVGRSQKLKQLALLTGRFTRIALDVQRSRVQHPPDEVTSIAQGSDLARVLPSEIALLTDPELEALFLLKFAEGHLLQYDLIGSEKQGRGAIIMALDSSGSMGEPLPGVGGGYSKEVWAKAVALAILAIARLQKRDMAVIHFSNRDQLSVHRFPKGEGAYPDVIACAELFYGQGTEYEPWMSRALELIEESSFDRADVICVSDGLAHVGEAVTGSWGRARIARGMRAYSVLLGTHHGADLLGALTDAVLTLEDLTDEGEVLKTVFGV